MEIFRTGHDVRAYARSHDGVSLRAQRAEDTELVRNLICDFSGNVLFLERVKSAIVYLHRQLNFGAGDVPLCSSGFGFLAGTGKPSPDKEQMERMSAALIRLCTRRHATFDKIFYSESHLPRHITEILRDLADLTSVARSRSMAEGQGAASQEPPAEPTGSDGNSPVEPHDAQAGPSFAASADGTLQNDEVLVPPPTNETERDELSPQRERASSSISDTASHENYRTRL
ncbi:hypothetical protein [Pandoraea pulmonicola]|uniref:Uncharacterized protein n=1 Tax=Pandoraea pulmonicola TaxID=93221 RepID=A0AAJ5CYV4_PANPU|nr:hypothetical protein [Pandoraea pulmonicola]SUA88971.1 Uncharacterised protein [Pandoraea pulmonicola]